MVRRRDDVHYEAAGEVMATLRYSPFFIVVSWFVLGVPTVQAAIIGEQFKTARNGIVHIGVYEPAPADPAKPRPIKWLGTAFVLDENCTFATAKHVLSGADPSQLVVRFQLPDYWGKVRTVPIRVLSQSPTRDLAFLRIDRFNDKPCKSGSLHVFPIYPDDVARTAGQTVIIIGYPVVAGEDLDIPIVRSGIVASTEVNWQDGPMLLLDLLGVPGFSGSPVVLVDTGQVIGVVFGPGPTRRAYGFEWATPLSPADLEWAITQVTQPPDGGEASK